MKRDPIIIERCHQCWRTRPVKASLEGATSCPHCGGKPLNVLMGEAAERAEQAEEARKAS